MTIVLHQPVASSEWLERINAFPGRYLNEQDLDARQAYAEARMGSLVDVVAPGILRGLNTRLDTPDQAGTAVTVAPGIGVAGDGSVVGLYRPVTQEWSELVQDYRDRQPERPVKGIYYLVLSRGDESVDWSQDVDACRRFDLDPHRDTRREVVGRLSLLRLEVANDDVLDRMGIENLVAAAHADGSFLRHIFRALPVGLLAVDGNRRVRWFSEVAGRYMAQPQSGYQVLLNQVNEAFRMTLLAAGAGGDSAALRDYLNANLSLRYLPAAGQLPLELLRDRASPSPSMDWLPEHLRVDMIAVPEDSVAELMARHLARRPFDLQQAAAGEHLRLLLAVDNSAYRRDLLDIPQPDQRLEADLFRYHMRAYDSWRAWREQFDRLHHLQSGVELPAEVEASLDLPDAVQAPLRPAKFYGRLISAAGRELGSSDFNPYRHGVPEQLAFYRRWLVQGESGVLRPRPPATPVQNGYIVQHAIALVEMERLDNQIRSLRDRVEKTRDYLLLQRQQLDNQTAALASLAGGVAGDGSGLQVARWMPFTRWEPRTPEPDLEKEKESAPVAATASLAKLSLPLMSFAASPGTGFASSFKAPEPEPAIVSAKSLDFTKFITDKPFQVSSSSFTLNKEVFTRVAEAPRQVVTRPAFSAREEQFGVLKHIHPELSEYRNIANGMSDLLTTLDDLFDKTEAASLRNSLAGIGTPTPIGELEKLEPTGKPGDSNYNPNALISARYAAAFKAGNILTRQISFIEARYSALEASLERKLASRVQLEARIDKLRAVIRIAVEKLALLDRRRIEQLGDYGMVQRLVDDDWENVYRRDRERARILEQEALGLFYLRVRNTPVSQALPDPLALRYADDDDLVPGCSGDEDAEVPPELEEFFDAVLEVAVADWRRLRPLLPRLPDRRRLDYGFSLRRLRFQQRQLTPVAVKAAESRVKGLKAISLANTSLLHALASMAPPAAGLSLKKYNEAAARVLSLEDMLTTANGALRRAAQVQRDRLELAFACMLDFLSELAPSIRLQWAQLAEDDRLPVTDISRWPGLQVAEKTAFNTLRTLSELLRWWFGQLSPNATGEAKTALSNAVRAAIIHAAMGDPSEIIQGEVKVPPRVYDVGALLRLRLNRVVKPGTLLQLMDESQKVVGLLNVEDHDSGGTLANVVRAERRGLTVNQRFTVSAAPKRLGTGRV